MRRTQDRVIVVRDDLMIVIPANEAAFAAWTRLMASSGAAPIRIVILRPGTKAEDWRWRLYRPEAA